MTTLVDRLLDPRVAPALVQDLVALVGTTVSSRKGFMGVAVRGAYGAATRLKPNFVPAMIARLLPHWVARLEPLHAEHQRQPDVPFAQWLVSRDEEVAECLLSVTDELGRAKPGAPTAVLYKRIRPKAFELVKDAVPDLGTVLAMHLFTRQAERRMEAGDVDGPQASAAEASAG